MKFLIFLLFPVSLFGQDLYCREYKIEIRDTSITYDSACYVSQIVMTQKKYILTISTDRYLNRFAILRSFPLDNCTLMFAVIPGQPDQLYAIREESRPVYYFFSVHPIYQSMIRRVLKGTVLECSNKQICN